MFCNYWQVTEMTRVVKCMEAQQELLFQLAEVVPRYAQSMTTTSQPVLKKQQLLSGVYAKNRSSEKSFH